MKSIAIDKGHGVINDIGAVGLRSEDELTKELGDKLIFLLNKKNIRTYDVTPNYARSLNDSLRQRVVKANKYNPDLFVSLHFNAFRGLAFGSEVYCASHAGSFYAAKVLREIAKLGFYNRGVKQANFYVLRHTIMPAVLIECCFVDSHKDMALYDVNKMAIAICNGLLGIDGNYSPVKQNYLKVLARTPLKPSTDQAAALPDHQLVWIDPGKYPIKRFLPEEEGHYFIESADGKNYFVFAGHCEVV